MRDSVRAPGTTMTVPTKASVRDPDLSLFKEWRVADRQAHALERVLSKSFLDALQGRGNPPSADERAQARKMRQTADDLFQVAMADLKARAEAGRHHEQPRIDDDRALRDRRTS